jgi:predicted TIM-barrel fold metal-dependent hydrolase
MAERTTIIDGHLSLAADDEPLSGIRRFTGADAAAHLEGAWLDDVAAGAAVAGALVSVAPGPLGPADDLEAHHRHVTEAVAADPRLYGSVTVHPFHEASEVRTVVRRLVDEQGYRAIDLHPTAQCFLPHRVADDLAPLLTVAAELGVPVMVHTGEPPFAFPTLVAYLAERHPEVSFVIRNLGTQQVTYAREAIYVARRNGNVHLETAWGSAPMLREAVRQVGAERLIFSTDAPRQDPRVPLAAVTALGRPEPTGVGLDDAALGAVLGGNLARLLGR